MPARPNGAFRVARLDPTAERLAPRLTGRGASVLAACMLLIIAGLMTRDGDLTAIGTTGLLLMPAMAALSWWNLQRLEIAADVPARVTAEETFTCRIQLRNTRPLGDAFHLFIEHQLPGGGTLRFQSPWTPAQGESEVTMDGSVPRRGVFGGSRVLMRSHFPLGLFANAIHGHLAESMLVMPRPLVPRAMHDTTLTMETETMRTEQRRTPAAGELHGLRAYRPGDPIKWIHWPASTRGMGLVVREYDQPRLQARLALVVFHSSGSGRTLLRPENFEMALRLLTGTVQRLQRDGIPVELRADFFDWQAVHCTSEAETVRMQASLARVSRSKNPDPNMARQLITRCPPDTLVVAISDLPKSFWEEDLQRCAGRRQFHAIDPDTSHRAESSAATQTKGHKA